MLAPDLAALAPSCNDAGSGVRLCGRSSPTGEARSAPAARGSRRPAKPARLRPVIDLLPELDG